MNNAITPTVTDMNYIAIEPLTTDEISIIKSILGIDNTQLLNAIESMNSTMKKLSNTITDMRTSRMEEAKRIIDAINKLSASNVESAKSLIEVVTDVAKPKYDIFQTDFDEVKRTQWIKKIEGIIAGMCLEYNHKEEDIYSRIFQRMNTLRSHDVDKLYNEWGESHNCRTKVEMCSYSKELMHSLELGISAIAHKDIVNKIKSGSKSKDKKEIYNAAQRCPANVYAAITQLNKNPGGRTYQKAFKIAAENFDIPKMIEETKKKYKIAKCSHWFAISQYPDVVSKLTELYKNA